MTRYRWTDADGRTLYRGEIIAGRRWTPAWRVGIPGAVILAALWGAVLFVFLNVPLILAVIGGALIGQILLNVRQRRYSRDVWREAFELEQQQLLEDQETPEQRERRETQEGIIAERDHMRIALDAGFPYIDYADGRILTPAELPDALAEAERDLAAIEAINDMHDHLDSLPDRPTVPEDCRRVPDDQSVAGRVWAAEILDAPRERHEEPRSLPGPGVRTREAIRADLDQLAGHVRAGKVSGHTANSLRAQLIEEWQNAPGPDWSSS